MAGILSDRTGDGKARAALWLAAGIGWTALATAGADQATGAAADPGAATSEPLAPAGIEAPLAAPDHAVLHVQLVGSEPAHGDTLAEPPDTIRLEFSEGVDPALADLILHGPSGQTRALTPRGAPGAPRFLVATSPRLGSGAYRVDWRIVSADGHPVSGRIAFHVGPELGEDAGAADPEGRPREAGAPGEEGEAAGADADTLAEDAAVGMPDRAAPPGLPALLRGVAMALLLALAGLLVYQAWVAAAPSRRVRRAVTLLALATPLALAGHLVAWLVYLAPAGAGFDITWIGRGLSTETGRWELVRTGAAFLALWAATGRARRPGLAAVLVLSAVAVSGSVGHAAASDALWAVPAKSLHLLAVALWLGGLLWILIGEGGRPEFGRDARRVSRLALIAILVVAATGVAQALDLLEGPGQLLTTSYGRLVAGKVAGLVVLALFGGWNRFRVLPGVFEGGEGGPLRRSVALETFVMAAVLLLAGFLAYVPPPGL